jgi:uncharacterized repeat protein (TIGR01451 family)
MTGPASASLGGTIVYTIVATNRGPSDAGDVLVTDPAPPGLTLVSLDGPCTAPPGCSLPAGVSRTLTATFAIPPDYAGPDPIVNVASVASSTSDPNPARNSSQVTTSLNAPMADVAIAITDQVTEIAAGRIAIYTITVTNGGPATTGTRVVDTFDPAAFGAVQWRCVASGSSTCSASGVQPGNLDTLVTIDPGVANAVVFTVEALVQPDASGPVENTATVTVAPGVTDPVPGNDVATDVDTLRIVSDISVVKTGPSAIVPGTTADYEIVVANAGPSTVRNLQFLERQLDGATLVDGIPRRDLIQSIQPPADSQCDFAPGGDAPRCIVPSLAPGASRTFTVRLAIPSDYQSVQTSGPPVFTNAAVFETADSDTDPDDSDVVGLATAPLAPQADLVVTKIGPAAAVTGGEVSYFIHVSNGGPSAASNVVVNDLIPAGLSLVEASTPCAGGFPCTIAALGVGENIAIRVDLLVPADYAGPPTYANTATVTAATADPDTSNDSGTAVTIVVPEQADLAVTLTGRPSIAPGGLIDYVGRVTNLGPGPAINVTSSAVIPAGATFEGGAVPPAPTACAVPAPGVSNLISCVTPVLQAGEFIEFRFSIQVSSELPPGSLLTTVGTASSPTPDFNSSNDQADLITEVAAPVDAGMSVEVRNASPVAVGTAVEYTITARNGGPAAATGVTLTATLPPELTFVSAAPSQGTCTVTTCSLGTLAPGTAATVTVMAGDDGSRCVHDDRVSHRR